MGVRVSLLAGVNQLVVNENAAADNQPTTNRDFDRLACSVPVLDFAPQPAAEGKTFLFVLRLPINDKPLAGEPSVFDAYLVAFVIYVPSFHSDCCVVPQRRA